MILNIGICRFPNIGLLLPLNHPFYFRIHDKPSSYWGTRTMETCSRFFSASSISDKRTASVIHEDMFKPGWRKIHQVPFLNLKGFLYHPLPNYICKRHLSGLLWTTMFHDVSSSRNDDWSSKLGEIQLENQCQLMSTRIYHLPLSGIKHPKCVWLVVSTPIKQYARQWGGSTSYLLDGK